MAMESTAEPSPIVLARRQDVVVAMREVGAAAAELQVLFEQLATGVDLGLDRIEWGAGALAVARTMRLADRREMLNAAAARVRLARHNFQRAMFLLAMAEGSSLAEIARTWRVSRQLVSRMTKEAG